MEYKFRGFHPYAKKVMEVSCIDWMHDEVYFADRSAIGLPIDECNLMQYTGLKDVNGVEVCVGDIVEYSNDVGHHTEFRKKFIIEFGEQDLGGSGYQQTLGFNATPIYKFGSASKASAGRMSHGILDLFGCHVVKVIGNIHEEG